MDLFFDHKDLMQLSLIIMFGLSIIQVGYYIISSAAKNIRYLVISNFLFFFQYLTINVDIVLTDHFFPGFVAVFELAATVFWVMCIYELLSQKQRHKYHLVIMLINAASVYLFYKYTGNVSLIRSLASVASLFVVVPSIVTILRMKKLKRISSLNYAVLALGAFVVLKATLIVNRLFSSIYEAGIISIENSIVIFTVLALLLIIWINFIITFINLDLKNSILEEMAYIDFLTSTPNRRAIEIRLQELICLNARGKLNFYVILFDLDHFKAINDRYGHEIGDNVLIELSNMIMNDIREIDMIGRYGGDEFVILVINEDRKNFTSRLLASIRKRKFTECDLSVTISGGLIEVNSESNYTNIKDIISDADSNLYTAKQNGRNQLV